MKFPSPFVAAIIGLATLASASAGPVTVRVEQDNKTDLNKFKRTQHRVLKITLTNSGDASMNLRVRYAVFGRDSKTHAIVDVHHSDLTTTLQPKSDQTLTTAEAVAVLTEDHIENKKKVDGSGARLLGYGVQVLEGTTVVAEAYDPPAMKEELAKIPPPKPPAPKPAPKKK
jgi:hypothetical protein